VTGLRLRPLIDAVRADRIGNGALWWLVAVPCALVYAVTASWTYQGEDAVASAWPAWSLVHRGTLNLAGIHGMPGSEWFLHLHGQVLSNRMIGAVAAGVPANALLGWTGLGAAPAAALTAVVMSAAAVATLCVVLRSVAGLRWALAAAVVFAFGTAEWTVSSKELWTHTPDVLWISLVLLGLSRGRYLLSGLAFVPAVMTRPHLVVAAVVIAALMAVLRRSAEPAVAIAAPALFGVMALVVVNHAIYGAWSVTGGYGAVGYSVSSNISVTGGAGGVRGMVEFVATNVAGALVSPRCGLLLYVPIAALALMALPSGWRSAPQWTKAAAAGGVVYELAQCRINSFTGGAGFFSNRLILESLVACAPLLVHALRQWSARTPRREAVAIALAAASVAVHALGAVVPSLPAPGEDPWSSWYVLDVLRHGGTAAPSMAVVAVAVVVLALVSWNQQRMRVLPPVVDPAF
jgi:hypothetical protein